MPKVGLVVLTGGGDTMVKVVDEETFAWITGPAPAFSMKSGMVDPCVPASQVEKLKKDAEKSGYKYVPPYVTRGSCDNDRALAAMPADGYAIYWKTKDAHKAITNRFDQIIDEYQGNIY